MSTTITPTSLDDMMRQRLEVFEARRAELAEEANTILTRAEPTGQIVGVDQKRFKLIEDELAHLKEVEKSARNSMGMNVAVVPGSDTGASTPPVSSDPARAAHDGARRAIDGAHTRGELPDHAATRAESLLQNARGAERTLLDRWATAAGDPNYASAFARLAADPEHGHLEWTRQESDAWRAAQTLQRAMNIGTDGDGGYMVPMVLDPAIVLSSDGSADPLRRIARVVQTTSSSWKGVTSAGSSAEWKSESASAADASPTLSQPDVPVHLGDAFVPYSFEVGMDAPNFLRELQVVLADAAANLTAKAYMNGTGSGQPEGVVTGLGNSQKIPSASAGSIAADDVVGLQNALGPRFQPRAQWCANLTVINTIGGMETTNGAPRFPGIANGTLLRKPINEASELDSPGASAANAVLYGDFQQFVIADRIGAHLEFVQNLTDPTTGRPTGQRGALLWFRTGSKTLVPNGFRMLTVAKST